MTLSFILRYFAFYLKFVEKKIRNTPYGHCGLLFIDVRVK